MESDNSSSESVETVKGLDQVCRQLKEISLLELNVGVPYVGVILLPSISINCVKKHLESLFESVGDDYKIGFTRVVPLNLPGNEKYSICHLSSNTSKNFILHEEIIGLNPDTDCFYYNDICIRYYQGIRLHHPLYGVPVVNVDLNRIVKPTSQFTFAEVFAGIGGFRVGLEAIGGECVFSSELDAQARHTMECNFGPEGIVGDITQLYTSQIPRYDILTAGFPCQPFSVRGKQKGFDDTRGQLYRELLRMLVAHQPQAFLFENVTGLVYLNGGQKNKRGEPRSIKIGETFSHILKEFSEVGYDVTWHIVDSSNFLPQYRERVYIVGFRSDLNIRDFKYELDHFSNVYLNKYSSVGDILEDCISDHELESVTLLEAQWKHIQSPEYVHKTSLWKGRSGSARKRIVGLEDKSFTLTSGYKNPSNVATKFVMHRCDGSLLPLPRFYTKRECCRLMGFPESFVIPKEEKSRKNKMHSSGSENRFYHQIGNAVCPPVISSFGAQMIIALYEKTKLKE